MREIEANKAAREKQHREDCEEILSWAMQAHCDRWSQKERVEELPRLQRFCEEVGIEMWEGYARGY